MVRHKLIIEPARESDAQIIAMLSRDEIERGLGWSYTPSKILRAIRDPETNVVVARDLGVVAGFGIMEYGLDTANLRLLAVAREYRRRGLASEIVRWLEHVAINAGTFEISVQLRSTNHPALKLYEGLGYEVVDRVSQYYKLREDAIIMAKHLRGAESAT